MKWSLEFLPQVEKDMKKLDGSQKILVSKALAKVQQNPISIYEGGYGKPLGNKNQTDLTGLYKIKLKNAGIRIVYKLIKTKDSMVVVVIGARADEEVYKIAQKRNNNI